MAITYYDPNRPQQRQFEMFMQQLGNYGILRVQQKARLEELEKETTAAEKMMSIKRFIL